LEKLERPAWDPVIPVVEEGQDRWTPEAEVFGPALARLARRTREEAGLVGEDFRPLVWKHQASRVVNGVDVEGWFEKGSASDVHRFEKENGFTPLNLVETCRLLDQRVQGLGDKLMRDCVALVRHLYRGSRRPGPAARSPFLVAEVANAVAAGLRKAAEIATDNWECSWGRWPAESEWVEKVEAAIEQAVRDVLVARLRGVTPCWVARSGRRLPTKEGLVLVMEGLGGQRNFRYGLNLYTTSVAVAWATAGRMGQWCFEPICAGVCAVGEGQLYLGVAGEAGGAVVIDERERHHPARRLQGSPTTPSAEVAVGVHHSRSHKRSGREFVFRVSQLLPAYVNKQLALGAGAYSLSLTAAGNLGAYFEGSANLISAYAGAVILAAATGRPGSATDLEGNCWCAGNPLRKNGLLAWGHKGLEADIGDALFAAAKKKTALRAKRRKKAATP
jgi:fructose-1,6-bisphosphatase/inositol monophosphatase family enzyme